MRQLKDLSYTSCHMSFIYFPTQYDINFPNLFLRIFNHLENQYVVPYLGTRETKEKHDVCQNVCHHFDFAYNTLYSLINQGFMLLVKKETITNAIVCHENNLKQLEF